VRLCTVALISVVIALCCTVIFSVMYQIVVILYFVLSCLGNMVLGVCSLWMWILPIAFICFVFLNYFQPKSAPPRRQTRTPVRYLPNDETQNESRVKKKAVLVVGPAGSGKSSFINYYLKKYVAKVTPGGFSETSKVEPYDCTDDLVIIDTPGVGDVRDGKSKCLSNEEIFTKILVATKMYDVICVVIMVNIHVIRYRLDSNLVQLIEMLSARFINFFTLLEYGISEQNYEKPMTAVELGKLFYKNFEALKTVGINGSNINMCPRNNFSTLKRKVDRIYRSKGPVLQSVNFHVTCSRCFKTADYLLDETECAIHGTPSKDSGHQRSETYHSGSWGRFHSGTQKSKCKTKKYTCCGRTDEEEPCKEGWTCCHKTPQSSEGCCYRCSECKKNPGESGCNGICLNCDELLTSTGCLVENSHNWSYANLSEPSDSTESNEEYTIDKITAIETAKLIFRRMGWQKVD